MAEKVAKSYGLKPAALKAQVSAESGWKPKAVSYVWARDRKGRLLYRNGKPYKVPCAYGIAQFTPATGRSWGLRNRADLFNPVKSLDAMGRLMSSYVKTYKRQGDSEKIAYRKAHIAYNCGPGCVNKKATITNKKNTETPQYLQNIAAFEKQFDAKKPKQKPQIASVPVPGGN